MNRLLIPAAALAAAVTLAACGSGGGDGGAATAASSAGSPAISVKQIGDTGKVLVNSKGQALYASDEETAAHKVLCTGGCTSIWMPLTIRGGGVPSAGSVPGKLSVVKRPDGTRQLTVDGKLLYSFTQDPVGKATGDGAPDAFGGKQFTWHVIASDGSSSAGSGSGSTPPRY
jgi:predicted lipoprotein with Yx(FWY)xxD motif